MAWKGPDETWSPSKENQLINMANEAIRLAEARDAKKMNEAKIWVLLSFARNSLEKNPFIVSNNAWASQWWKFPIWIIDPQNPWYSYNARLVSSTAWDSEVEDKKIEASQKWINLNNVWLNHIIRWEIFSIVRPANYENMFKFQERLTTDFSYFSSLMNSVKFGKWWNITIRDDSAWFWVTIYFNHHANRYELPKLEEDSNITSLKSLVDELSKLTSPDYKPKIELPDYMQNIMPAISWKEKEFRGIRINELSSLIEAQLVTLGFRDQIHSLGV